MRGVDAKPLPRAASPAASSRTAAIVVGHVERRVLDEDRSLKPL